MNKSLISVVLILNFISCETEDKAYPYLIGEDHIGLLTDSTEVRDLDEIFSNDSIVTHIKGDEFMDRGNDIEIFSKDGKRLLTLSPSQVLDSTSVIKSVQIHDGAYKTENGITILSTFKDIKDNYEISKINNLINTVVLSVNEINASFTIAKEELPANLRYDLNMKIEKSQIPDSAKIKYFMLHW